MTRQSLPDNRKGIFEKLTADHLIVKDVGSHWNITNLDAILFANDLEQFDSSIARKAVRFVAYAGNNRAAIVTGKMAAKVMLQDLKPLFPIDNLLPHNEHIGKVFHEEQSLYSPIAIIG